ncbi:uncharacterized protein MONBRDRAFT_27777 [Monosiga brevicollis MX1]|uniref:Uncharacterized protein n=1 Tax=Monosiga brevicollis TaxID=81824 RepID=A9V6A3_MONBE|nr:uncharacterized protein MONBRDRAFT_27777 [Monosiga brevicollis MX1]EDQ86956.1 predicted protein [Monosiga brevicollis MX1]|eukprot:XP_001748195.1 hypothetical protein [Monosiga brevicollis MX1]
MALAGEVGRFLREEAPVLGPMVIRDLTQYRDGAQLTALEQRHVPVFAFNVQRHACHIMARVYERPYNPAAAQAWTLRCSVAVVLTRQVPSQVFTDFATSTGQTTLAPYYASLPLVWLARVQKRLLALHKLPPGTAPAFDFWAEVSHTSALRVKPAQATLFVSSGKFFVPARLPPDMLFHKLKQGLQRGQAKRRAPAASATQRLETTTKDKPSKPNASQTATSTTAAPRTGKAGLRRTPGDSGASPAPTRQSSGAPCKVLSARLPLHWTLEPVRLLQHVSPTRRARIVAEWCACRPDAAPTLQRAASAGCTFMGDDGGAAQGSCWLCEHRAPTGNELQQHISCARHAATCWMTTPYEGAVAALQGVRQLAGSSRSARWQRAAQPMLEVLRELAAARCAAVGHAPAVAALTALLDDTVGWCRQHEWWTGLHATSQALEASLAVAADDLRVQAAHAAKGRDGDPNGGLVATWVPTSLGGAADAAAVTTTTMTTGTATPESMVGPALSEVSRVVTASCYADPSLLDTLNDVLGVHVSQPDRDATSVTGSELAAWMAHRVDVAKRRAQLLASLRPAGTLTTRVVEDVLAPLMRSIYATLQVYVHLPALDPQDSEWTQANALVELQLATFESMLSHLNVYDAWTRCDARALDVPHLRALRRQRQRPSESG